MSEAYSRVYHRFVDEFADIFIDDHALSAWIRLLLLADSSWPMRPPLPRSVRGKVLRNLVDSGLLIVVGDTYTVRGLDAERSRRRNSARVGSHVRWHSNGTSDGNANGHAIADANAHATAMPRRVRVREEKKIPPPPTEWGRREDGTNPRSVGSNPRANGDHPRANGTSPRQEREAEKRGPTKLGEILAKASTVPDDEWSDL